MRQYLENARAYLRVLARARRNRTDLLRWMWRRPQLLGAIGAYESALFSSGRAPTRLKYLAMLRASSLIGCPF